MRKLTFFVLFALSGCSHGLTGTWTFDEEICNGIPVSYGNQDERYEFDDDGEARLIMKVGGCTETIFSLSWNPTSTGLMLDASPASMFSCSPGPTCSGTYTLAVGDQAPASVPWVCTSGFASGSVSLDFVLGHDGRLEGHTMRDGYACVDYYKH